MFVESFCSPATLVASQLLLPPPEQLTPSSIQRRDHKESQKLWDLFKESTAKGYLLCQIIIIYFDRAHEPLQREVMSLMLCLMREVLT